MATPLLCSAGSRRGTPRWETGKHERAQAETWSGNVNNNELGLRPTKLVSSLSEHVRYVGDVHGSQLQTKVTIGKERVSSWLKRGPLVVVK